jgi:hypothetical protein
MPLCFRSYVLALSLVLVSRTSVAVRMQPPTPPPPHKPPAVSPLNHAGYIFAGTVKNVRRDAPHAGAVATMEITFHVDKAMRGVHTGESLVIHEWAGLWQAGERYQPGEQLLLFLYPPSKLGLTSAVGGEAGRFKLDERGQVILDPVHAGTIPKTANTTALLKGKTRVGTSELLRDLKLAGGE